MTSRMTRAVCCVATTAHYQKGMARLIYAADEWTSVDAFWKKEPEGCPPHAEVPYAFKAYALKSAAEYSDLLLWADASILPIRSLEPLWERIERDGFWIARNGW